RLAGAFDPLDNLRILVAVAGENGIIKRLGDAVQFRRGHTLRHCRFANVNRKWDVGHDDAFDSKRQPAIGRLIERGAGRPELEVEAMPILIKADADTRRVELKAFER